MSDENKLCCGGNQQKEYNPEDVTTWSAQEFEDRSVAKLRKYWNQLEAIKFLMRDGKVWVAGEKIQGLSEGIGFLIGLYEQRLEGQKNCCNTDINKS